MIPLTIDRPEFRRGFAAMLPLWLGVVPFAAAFAILARTSGLSTLETQALSVLVFAGSAQLAFVDLTGAGAGAAAILITVLLLNLRHVLYGLSLNTLLPSRTAPPRPLLAALLTDESYGLTIRDFRAGRGSAGFLFGASLSLFLSFAVATLAGALLGSYLPDPDRIGLSTVFPLSFLALLLPLLRNRIEVVVAAAAGLAAIVINKFTEGGITILIVTIAGAGLGTLLHRRESGLTTP